jgi:hypothetical protein
MPCNGEAATHPAVKGILVNVADDDDHLLRRRGAAVVKHWELLSREDRELILEQATFTTDAKSAAVQLREQLESMINEHRLDKNA